MAQTPTQRGPDARIREVNYTDGNVIQIRSAFRTATQIEFAPGEVIKFVAMGDTVSWEVAPADNSLFVKPRERAGATNLIVVTDCRAHIVGQLARTSRIKPAPEQLPYLRRLGVELVRQALRIVAVAGKLGFEVVNLA
nr:TrbG/VirB9 family P-type conjugative transfer protein [Sphingomonas sp. S2M10]